MLDTQQATRPILLGVCVIDRNMVEPNGQPALRLEFKHSEGLWRSGHWVISKDIADLLIGKSLWIHRSQAAPSHFGGEIVDCFYETYPGSPPDKEYTVFLFRARADHNDVRTAGTWAQVKKYVWSNDE
ncbi:MAG: hypothetical protein EON54_01390 [Alcaligenaceae bacterium]|nr:MAG: hypothetical protein EON54_01390 [Alcaligenaceae bacterium]